MYHKYHTEAIVLVSRERGEADRVIALYTREFGLVHARASSVRSEVSKMRMALQSYSRVRVSLVRGKRDWRAAGALALSSALHGEALRAFARIAALTVRLVAGEEKNTYLFDSLVFAHASLADRSDACATIELVAVARILYALGYLSAEALNVSIFAEAHAHAQTIAEAEHARDPLLAAINHALSQTHL